MFSELLFDGPLLWLGTIFFDRDKTSSQLLFPSIQKLQKLNFGGHTPEDPLPPKVNSLYFNLGSYHMYNDQHLKNVTKIASIVSR